MATREGPVCGRVHKSTVLGWSIGNQRLVVLLLVAVLLLSNQLHAAGEIQDVSRERKALDSEIYSIFEPVSRTIVATAYATDFSIDSTISTSGATGQKVRFVYSGTPTTIFTTQSVLDATSRETLVSGGAVIVGSSIEITLPTTSNQVIARLQTVPGINWTTLPAQITLACETRTSGGTLLDSISNIKICPRAPSVPAIIITTPAHRSSKTATRAVTFAASATDLVDGTISDSGIRFTSSLQGPIGSGTFSTTTLVLGLHEITASITNTANATGYEVVAVTITPPMPVPAISTPSATSTITYPASLALAGSATDELSGSYTDGALTWSSSVNGALGSGASLTITPTIGSHYFTLTATNGYGGLATADRLVHVIPPSPGVTITSPPSPFFNVVSTTLNLTGTVSMPDSSPVSSSDITWASDRYGLIGTGTSTGTASLMVGRHALSLIAQSSYGTTGSAQVFGIIAPATDGSVIVSPLINEVYETGLPVLLEGLGSHPTFGPYSEATASWSSNLHGTLVTGTSIAPTTSLTNGTHTLTFTISDHMSNVLTRTVQLIVVKRVPRLELFEPEPGAAYTVGTPVTLVATGIDLVLGPLDSNTFIWRSGAHDLGSGSALVVTTLPVGSHTLTLTVTGPAGGTAISTVGITVTTLPVTLATSVFGTLRTTAGVPLNGRTVEVYQVASNRTGSMLTPTPSASGTYHVRFPSAPHSVGPTSVTTYQFTVNYGGTTLQSMPGTSTVTAGMPPTGFVGHDLFVP